MSMHEGAPSHERRNGDADLKSVAFRVNALESRMQLVEDGLKGSREEVRENTKITTRIRVLLEGTEVDANGERVQGMRDKVSEMYDTFDTAKSGFRMIGKAGDFIDRNGRRIFWLGLIAFAGMTYWKTGKLPDWLVSVIA